MATNTASSLHARDVFVDACLEIDGLLAKLTELRQNHFDVDAEARTNWGDVGSARFVQQKLVEALAHYGIGGED